MEVTYNKLFLYDDVRRLLMDVDGTLCNITDNAPMNKKTMKVHKGIDNKLSFRVFDPDRKPVNVCKYNIFARIFNIENRELVLEKQCTTNSATGMIFLSLDEGDLANVSVGTYDIVLVGQEDFVYDVVGEKTTIPFYVDYDRNISTQLIVTGQAERVPVPSIIIDEDNGWTETQVLLDGKGPMVSQFHSEIIPGARVRNHINGVHSFSVYTDEENKFTGTLEVLGTLDLSPKSDPNVGWFRISVVTGSDVLEFIDFFGTEAFTFTTNVMYLKFRYTPSHEISNPGKIKKIIVRT